MKIKIRFKDGNVRVIENVVSVCYIKSMESIMINQKNTDTDKLTVTMIKKDEIRSYLGC